MIHKTRMFSVKKVESTEELAHMLTERTWCLCNGFQLGDLYFLNDSFSEDGAQEYAVFKDGHQIESITFGWCSFDEALRLINDLMSGKLYMDMRTPMPFIESPEQHGSCHLCE